MERGGTVIYSINGHGYSDGGGAAVNDELENVEYSDSSTANKDKDYLIGKAQMEPVSDLFGLRSPEESVSLRFIPNDAKCIAQEREIEKSNAGFSLDPWLLHLVKMSAFLLFIMGSFYVGKTMILFITMAICMVCKVQISPCKCFGENPKINSRSRNTTTVEKSLEDMNGQTKQLPNSLVIASVRPKVVDYLLGLQALNLEINTTITTSDNTTDSNKTTPTKQSKRFSNIRPTDIDDISSSPNLRSCALSSSINPWSMFPEENCSGTSTVRMEKQQGAGKLKNYKNLLKYLKIKEKGHQTRRMTSNSSFPGSASPRPWTSIDEMVRSNPSSPPLMMRASRAEHKQQVRSNPSSPTFLMQSMSSVPKSLTNGMEEGPKAMKKRAPWKPAGATLRKNEKGMWVRVRVSTRWIGLLGFAVSMVGIVASGHGVAIAGLVCFWYAAGNVVTLLRSKGPPNCSPASQGPSITKHNQH